MGPDEIFGGMPFLYGSPLADLELAPLNPDLGQYFGTDTGVLVISVPAESQLGFKGGDVDPDRGWAESGEPLAPAANPPELRRYRALQG